jgi:hypothetical protein
MSQKPRSIATLMPTLAAPIVRVVDRALAFQMGDRWQNATEMQGVLRDAYQTVEKHPLPGTSTVPRLPADLLSGSDVDPESVAPITSSAFDVAVSVVFEPDEANDSIVVDFEDPTGTKERYEIRRKSERALLAVKAEPSDELSDISVVELVDD